MFWKGLVKTSIHYTFTYIKNDNLKIVLMAKVFVIRHSFSTSPQKWIYTYYSSIQYMPRVCANQLQKCRFSGGSWMDSQRYFSILHIAWVVLPFVQSRMSVVWTVRCLDNNNNNDQLQSYLFNPNKTLILQPPTFINYKYYHYWNILP